MCELYDRPAEIYAYDPVEGARKLRVFHSARSDARPPIRLSYFGGGHYDSVVGAGWRENLLPGPPGAVEARRIAASRAAATSGGMGDSAAALDIASTEEATIAAALALSRDQFDMSTENLDAALLNVELAASAVAASSGVVYSSSSDATATSAMQPSSSANLAANSALPAASRSTLESQILHQVMQASADSLDIHGTVLEQSRVSAEAEAVNAALQASIRDVGACGSSSSTFYGCPAHVHGDDAEMQAALALSLGAADVLQRSAASFPPVHTSDLDALYNIGLDMSEDQQLARLLQLTRDEDAQRARQLQVGRREVEQQVVESGVARPDPNACNSSALLASTPSASTNVDDDDEDMLQAALAASLQQPDHL
jgi:hypothetical protein